MLGVNFIHILQVPFFYKSALQSFSLIIVWLWFFGQKNIGAKATYKMSMKLTTGVNSINIFVFYVISDRAQERLLKIFSMNLGEKLGRSKWIDIKMVTYTKKLFFSF